MIKFDIKKLRVETHKVKALTTALGGSISVLDEEESTDNNEVYHRVKVPMSVIRAFQVRHKTMKYIRPVLVAVAYYEDRAIALERHPAGCMGERWEWTDAVERVTKQWIPAIQSNIEKKIIPVLEKGGEWFFDGRYIFTFDGTSAEQSVKKGEFLSKDGRFRCVEVDAIGLHKLEDSSKITATHRTCLAYVAANGKYAISPPIWKDARAVGQAKVKGANTERSGGEKDFQFDSVDGFCAVNISFALKAAKELSAEFGFEAIEPLNLPGLMVRLNTVNLPKVPSEVKDTFDSGMKFTHALAWLLGFARRCNDLDTYASIRTLLKYLTANGLFLKSAFDPSNIFKAGHDLDSIPVLSKEEAMTAEISLEERLKLIRAAATNQTRERSNVVAGVLHNDEDD